MINSRRLCVYQNIENKDGRGISVQIIIMPNYLDEPPFTQEQLMAIHEICDSFLLVNRAREQQKRQAERRRDKRKHEP